MSPAAALRHPFVRGLVPVALLLGLWQVSVALGWVGPLVLVSFPALFRAAADPAIGGALLDGLAASGLRLAEGASIGIAGGLFFGVGLGVSRLTDRVFGPGFHAFRQVAIFAWIPLLTAWFGNGDLSKIVFVALAAFGPVAMGAFEGVKNVPSSYVEVGRVLCFSRGRLLWRIVLPAAAPAIFTGLQLALIFSWFATVGAEYLIGGLTTGIGTLVMKGREEMRTDVVLLGIIAIALTGLGVNGLLRLLSRRLFAGRVSA
ncbi:sulfonate transport system permease protein [Verrucomicrobium sp. GAS474]|uniref:ABC transporter permease n=1 Tax=Verrucomicrobium sp. GAS474 TaxID=1882831 RepID=UPI00087D06AB|nr:ABC transporter permease subunit [Verrucomicrobium sp. GAS474]SDT85770.1 sulfonate transport system permease protein [Verrucomicrobium sp. GAS474]